VAIHDIGLVVGAVVEQDDQRARIDAMFHGHVGMACPQFMSTHPHEHPSPDEPNTHWCKIMRQRDRVNGRSMIRAARSNRSLALAHV
jgi:hypothetical protein